MNPDPAIETSHLIKIRYLTNEKFLIFTPAVADLYVECVWAMRPFYFYRGLNSSPFCPFCPFCLFYRVTAEPNGFIVRMDTVSPFLGKT